MNSLRDPDYLSRSELEHRAGEVLRPKGALHRLDEIAVWLAGWQRTASPSVEHPALIVFAADHGVCVEGVSAYPSSVTREVQLAMRCCNAPDATAD